MADAQTPPGRSRQLCRSGSPSPQRLARPRSQRRGRGERSAFSDLRLGAVGVPRRSVAGRRRRRGSGAILATAGRAALGRIGGLAASEATRIRCRRWMTAEAGQTRLEGVAETVPAAVRDVVQQAGLLVCPLAAGRPARAATARSDHADSEVASRPLTGPPGARSGDALRSVASREYAVLRRGWGGVIAIGGDRVGARPDPGAPRG